MTVAALLPMEERVGHAFGARDLSSNARRVTDTDLIAAFAMTASRVGAACWRVKYGGDVRHAEVRLVVAKVARALTGRFRRPSRMMILVASEALFEWIQDVCRVCHGRGWVGFSGLYGEAKIKPGKAIKSCSVCNGTGALRRNEHDRAAALNRSIAEWNASNPPLLALRHLTWETLEGAREARRWSARIDDGVGYIRSHTDFQRAVRKKLG
jgi:hypothetical protein